MNKNDTGSFLLKKGKNFYSLGKTGCIFLIVGFWLTIIINFLWMVLFGFRYSFFDNAIVILASGLTILLIVAGIFLAPLYFFGLHYMGLGRICINTEK